MQNNNPSIMQSIKKYQYGVFYLFLGVVLGFILSLVIQLNSELQNLLISPESARLPLVATAGAFGGLLRSLQTKSLTVSNSLIGIGGALIVFLIVPAQITQMTITELLGTALIGGYGGGSLLDQALQSISDKVDENAQKLAETEKQLQAANQKIEKTESQNQINAETLSLLSRYLDKSLDLSKPGEDDLMNNIQNISATARRIVFEKTQEVFYRIRDQQSKDSVEKTIIKNALKLFERLSDTDEQKNNDRYPAHAAYAYMELKKWDKAIKQLEEAKKRLKTDSNKGENEQNERVYNAYIVVCKTQYSPENKEEIIGYLRDIKDIKQYILSKYHVLLDNFMKENNINEVL